MTDREFIEHTLQWLKLSAEVAPFVQKRVVIDSIEQHLGESRRNPSPYQTFTLTGKPQQEAVVNQSLCPDCEQPNFSIPRMGIYHVCKVPDRRETYTNGTSFSDQTIREFYRERGPYSNRGMPQVTWRCEHYPSALENFYNRRHVCDVANCHLTELRWYDNGTCKPQTS